MEQDYYLRDLTADDWQRFQELDKLIFPEEPLTERSFIQGLSSPKTQSVVMIHKESKGFLGFYRIGVQGQIGYISRVGVHPEHRGKGYGAKLLERSMFQLNKAGCKRYYLYVKEENEAAKNLYEKYQFEIDTKSWQFEVPYEKLPEKARGEIRHLDWGEIQLQSLRFNLNPFQIQNYFGKEGHHVLVYSVMGQELGFCRFTPDFPGAMPFVLKDPEYVFDFIKHLKQYITNKDFSAIKITFDGQERLLERLQKENIPMRYCLLKLTREAEIKEEDES